MNALRPFFFATILPLLLPSCVQWNIGQRIREGGERYTGVDILHPVDGKLYRTPAMLKDNTALARVPEVTYSKRTSLVTLLGHKEARNRVAGVTPTGQIRVARLSCEETADWAPWRKEHTPREFLELAEGIPAAAGAYPVAELGNMDAFKLTYHSSYGSLAEPTKPSLGRQLAAVPFDYLVDPALSLTHSALNVPVFAVAAPFVILYMHLTDSRF